MNTLILDGFSFYADRCLVDDVSLTLRRGRVLALVGNSGCGKSLTCNGALGELPPGVRRTAGQVLLDGRIVAASALRGRLVSCVMQNPRSAFNPLRTIRDHARETCQALGKNGSDALLLARLADVGLEQAARVLSLYPFEMSGGMLQRVMIALALLGFSIPVFWLALLLTLFFSLTLGWLPVSGRFDLLYEVKTVTGFAIIDAWLSDSPWRDEMIVSALRHMVLPVLTLAVAPTTEVIRLMRLSTIDVFEQNYIKAAATRGVSRFTILRRHVLHNALPPVIPRLGLQFSTMLTLAMITEMVFSWPGLGRWMINAIRQQDYAAISAGVMVIGALVITVNVISDIVGALANPLKHKEWYALR